MENVRVFNSSPLYVNLSGTIQAEKYHVNFGLSSEECTDTGGGQNMGYTNVGDYLDYLVYAPTTGTYSFDFRLASTSGGTIEMRLVDNPTVPVIVQTVTVPNTGGWQTWQTVTVSGIIPQGAHTLRLYIKKPEFNINWFKASFVTSNSSLDETSKFEVYPNPVKDQIFLNTTGLEGSYQVKITNLQGVVVTQFNTVLGPGSALQTDVASLADGVYILTLENKSEKYTGRFIKRK